MRTTKGMIVNVMVALVAFFAASCADALHNEIRPKEAEAIPVDYEPQDSSHVVVNYNDGSREWNVQHSWTLEAEDTIKVQGVEAFKAAERLEKKAQDELLFEYTYDKTNTVKVSGLAMSYKGRTIYPKNANNVFVKGSREVVTEVAKPYYELSATNYSLVYGSIRLASARQMFIVDEGYVPAYLRTIWNYKHGAFERNAQSSNNVITVRCNNIANFCGEWDDNTYRDSLEVSYPVANKFAFSATEIKVNDLTTVIGKTFNFTNGVVTIAGSEVKATWQSAEVIGNVMYKDVNYKDNITACVCAARTITFNTASQATIKFYDHNANDYAETTVAVKVTENEKPVTLVGVDSTFVHNAFVSTATVSGNNIAVICNNTASFVKVWSNGKKDAKQDVKYVVTNNFSYSMPSYISLEAKGKTYSFNGSTATVVGKNVIVTFTSRVIADIMFNNKNYKNDKAVPQCEVAVKTIKFGESTAVITFSHDSETVTAEVPVSYNGVSGYERVGDPIHDAWNSAYSTSNGFGITCNNHVVVREVYTDGSKGSSFDLPYKSTNTWVVSGKTSFQVESLSSVLNVREDIVNGSASVAGNVINFAHSMSAEKVSKGTFSYQPSVCEAVAKYITVTSSTTARVDIYHDNTKVGEYLLPVNITEKEKPHDPDFVGKIIYGWATDSYANGDRGVAARVGTDFHFVVEHNGSYTIYSREVEETTAAWTTTPMSADEIDRISTSKPLAWTGTTPRSKMGYIEQCVAHSSGNGYVIDYYTLATGTRSRVIGMSGATFTDEYRYPVQGTWTNGKITVDGKVYTFTGSED